jgi:hypothetical protein
MESMGFAQQPIQKKRKAKEGAKAPKKQAKKQNASGFCIATGSKLQVHWSGDGWYPASVMNARQKGDVVEHLMNYNDGDELWEVLSNCQQLGGRQWKWDVAAPKQSVQFMHDTDSLVVVKYWGVSSNDSDLLHKMYDGGSTIEESHREDWEANWPLLSKVVAPASDKESDDE